jgi:hypothetical protein
MPSWQGMDWCFFTASVAKKNYISQNSFLYMVLVCSIGKAEVKRQPLNYEGHLVDMW